MTFGLFPEKANAMNSLAQVYRGTHFLIFPFHSLCFVFLRHTQRCSGLTTGSAGSLQEVLRGLDGRLEIEFALTVYKANILPLYAGCNALSFFST